MPVYYQNVPTFYDNIDDSMLKLAVIIAKHNKKWYSVSIEESHQSHRKCIEGQ